MVTMTAEGGSKRKLAQQLFLLKQKLDLVTLKVKDPKLF
jgi:hypothetical protein